VAAPSDEGETPPASDKPILLVRDTNGWCPFAQRVFHYLAARFGVDGAPAVVDTAFVSLRNKPAWHLKAAAANGAKVPAVFLNDGSTGGRRVIVESLDIMRELEADPGLAAIAPPLDAGAADPGAVAAGLALVDPVTVAGYALSRAAAPPPPAGSPYAALPPPPPLAEARAAFEAKLQEFAGLLASTSGPFIGGAAPSTADIAFAPHMERLAANLPAAAGAGVDPRAASPEIGAWFDALEATPAYLLTRGDATTHRVVSKRLFGGALTHPPYVPADPAAAAEAAAKLVANRAAVVADAVKNSGIADEARVDAAVRRVVATLVDGHPGPVDTDDPAACAAAAAVAAFLASRVSAPRDMTGSAATELRAACARAGGLAAYTGL
jgi:glutathione S-transferase